MIGHDIKLFSSRNEYYQRMYLFYKLLQVFFFKLPLYECRKQI